MTPRCHDVARTVTGRDRRDGHLRGMLPGNWAHADRCFARAGGSRGRHRFGGGGLEGLLWTSTPRASEDVDPLRGDDGARHVTSLRRSDERAPVVGVPFGGLRSAGARARGTARSRQARCVRRDGSLATSWQPSLGRCPPRRWTRAMVGHGPLFGG